MGASLERRVWTITAKGPTYPNLFTILVGRPGIGKSEAINGVRALIRATPVEGISESVCNLAPVDVTKASLYDYLASAKVRRTCQDPADDALMKATESHYHSAFLAVSELSDLIREHDTQLLSALHGLYDCLPFIEEERRYRADNAIKIPRPQVSLLGGTTPATITRTFPAQAWDEGFLSRSILIYSDRHIEPDLFGEDTDSDPMATRALVDDLRRIGQIRGRYIFTPEAIDTIKAWQKGGKLPRPDHPRLEHYNTRRLRHSLKLAMVAAASRSDRLLITHADFQEGLSWLVEAEQDMPKLFLEMIGKSDGQVMNELYHFVRKQWESPVPQLNKQPVRRGALYNHLRYKVPHYQIASIIEAACAAELLEGVIGVTGVVDCYKPVMKAGLYKYGKPN